MNNIMFRGLPTNITVIVSYKTRPSPSVENESSNTSSDAARKCHNCNRLRHNVKVITAHLKYIII